MATEGEAAFSAAATASSSETARGVGGKLKRKTARRHTATPYSRPQQNQIQRRPWISRIVDPAYRIISGGATRLLPYFFSKIASNPALTALEEQDHNHQQDELQNDLQENDPCITPSLNKPGSASVEEEGCTSIANVNEGKFSSGETSGKKSLKDVVEISELERLMEGKTFSQTETDRLIEIITSRAIDLHEAKIDERNLGTPLGEGINKNMSFFDNRKDSIGGKDANKELWPTPTPLAQSIRFDEHKIRDETSLSPAQLAKAYMGSHTSSSISQGFGARNEKNGFDRSIYGAKLSVGSPSSKPSACWPGIKSSEQYGYETPQSQRGNFGLQNFPRTPYSRTLLSNSRSKTMQLQDDSSKRPNTFQTRYSQLNLSQEKDVGTFGPNRRSRQSNTMSPYSRPSTGRSRFENSNSAKSFEAGEPSNLYKSQTTTAYGEYKGLEVSTSTVPTHSRQIAKTILNHLERTQPTPKEKSAELKLSTSWRYKSVEPNSSKDGSTKLNEDNSDIFSQNPPSYVPKSSAITTGETQNAMMKTASASNGMFRGTHEASSTLQNELGKPKGSITRTTHDEGSAKPANVFKPPSHPLGNSKPVLPSISVSKPFQKWTAPSGCNAGFTFPVSSPDGATSSEPTTPSIMPFTTSPAPSPGPGPLGVSVQSRHEATKDDEIPQFKFDSNRGDKLPLVFGFPSVREEAIKEDDEKFTFGSRKPERISLSLEGSNGVCC